MHTLYAITIARATLYTTLLKYSPHPNQVDHSSLGEGGGIMLDIQIKSNITSSLNNIVLFHYVLNKLNRK